MHRPTVAAIAIILACGAVYFWFFPPPKDNINLTSLFSACVRLSIVMTALWLALPQISHYSPRLIFFLIIGIMIFLIALKPRHIYFIIPIIIALWQTRHWHQPPETRQSPKDQPKQRQT